MKRSSHQNLAADIRREIRRMKTAVVDRMVKVMLYARKDLDRSLVTSIIFELEKAEFSKTATRDRLFAKGKLRWARHGSV